MQCPHCGSSNRIEAKFCDECGQRLPQADALPGGVEATAGAGARRLVTVLFADVCGFTARMEGQEPEWVHRDLNRLYSLCDPILQRHGGTLHKRQADGVMVLFGVPLAREDDSWRAVAAGWDMLRALEQLNARLRTPLALSIGVESGWVVFDQLGSALLSEDTVLGEAANLAARLQSAAGAGQILVGETVKRATARLVDYRPLRPLRLKNVAGRVQAYAVEALHPERLGTTEAARAMLAGRERELGALGRQASRLSQGIGGVVCLRGEPGIGKTRLKEELRAMAPEARWIEAAGAGAELGAAQASAAYGLFASIARQVLGIGPNESAASIRVRLAHHLDQDPTGPMVGWIESLLGLPVDSVAHYDDAARQRGVREAVTAMLARAVAEQPLIVAVEDHQWADAASRELLDWLVDHRPAGPLLFCVVTRPGFEPPWLGRDDVELLSVERLDDRSSRRLLYKLTGNLDLPPELVELVVEQAGGNPFFLAELVNWLRDEKVLVEEQGGLVPRRAVAGLEVPATIQMIVQARIDRLEPRARELLQVAAVIGQEFDDRLLRQVFEADPDEPLGALLAEELIGPKGPGLEPGYRFKHVVSRELAYRSLLLDRRQELHQRVAGAIEALHENQLAEHYETLAWHWQQAEEWDRAAECYELAGERAQQVHSEQAAATMFELVADSRQRWRDAEAGLDAVRAVGRTILLSVLVVLLYLTTRELLPAFGSYFRWGGLRLTSGAGPDWQGVWHAEVRAATTFLFTALLLLGGSAALLCRRPQRVAVHPGRLHLRRGRAEWDLPFTEIMKVVPRAGSDRLLRSHPSSGHPLAAMPDLELTTVTGRLAITGDEVAPFLAALWKEHREGNIDAVAMLDPGLAQRMAAVGSTYVVRRQRSELLGPFELPWLLEQTAIGQLAPTDEIVVRRPPPWDEQSELPSAPAATVADIAHPAVTAVCRPAGAALGRAGAALGGNWVRPLVAAGVAVGLGLTLLVITAPAQLADAYAAALPGLGFWLLACWLMTGRGGQQGERLASRSFPPRVLAGWGRFESLARQAGRAVLGLDSELQPTWRVPAQVALTGIIMAAVGAAGSYRLLLEWHYPPHPLLAALVVGGWSVASALLARGLLAPWARWLAAAAWTAAAASSVVLLAGLGPPAAVYVPPVALAGLLGPVSVCGWLAAERLARRRPSWGADLGPTLLTALLAGWLARNLVATAVLPAGPAVVRAALPWALGLVLLALLLRRASGTRLAGLGSLVALAAFAAGAPGLQHAERAMLARWFEGVNAQPWLIGALLVVSSPWLWGAGCLVRAAGDVATARGLLRCTGHERARRRPGRRWRRSWLTPRSRWDSRCGRRWRGFRLTLEAAVPLAGLVIAGCMGPDLAASAALHARPLRQAAALSLTRAGHAGEAAALVVADPPQALDLTWLAAGARPTDGLVPGPMTRSEQAVYPETVALVRLREALGERRDAPLLLELAKEMDRRRRPGSGPALAAECARLQAQQLRASGRLAEALVMRERRLADLRQGMAAGTALRDVWSRGAEAAEADVARARLDLGDRRGAAEALRRCSVLAKAEAALAEAREVMDGRRAGRGLEFAGLDPEVLLALRRQPSYALSPVLALLGPLVGRDLPLAALELRIGAGAAGGERCRRLLRLAGELHALALSGRRADRPVSGRGGAPTGVGRALAGAWTIAEWVCYLQGDLVHSSGAWRPAGLPADPRLDPRANGQLLRLDSTGRDWLRGAWLVGDKSDIEARLDLLNLARLGPHDAELWFASAEGYRKEGDGSAALRDYGRYLEQARIPTAATAQPRLMKLLRSWGEAPPEADYQRAADQAAARVRRHVMEATQARRRVAARWPLMLGLAVLTASPGPADTTTASCDDPGATPTTTGYTYSDLYWMATVFPPLGYTADPVSVAGELTMQTTLTGPSAPLVDFLWDYSWYFFDEYWNYVGEEYQQNAVPGVQAERLPSRPVRRAPLRMGPQATRLATIDLVEGDDHLGHILPDRGATLSKHWRTAQLAGDPTDGSYSNLLGFDLSQANEVYYFPRPDISIITRTMAAQDGSPLQFRRVFREKSPASSAGMPAGWFHSWDVSAVQATDGSVNLQLPGLDVDNWPKDSLGKSRETGKDRGYVLHVRGGKSATGYGRLIVDWPAGAGAGTKWLLTPSQQNKMHFRLHSVTRPSGEIRWFRWDTSASPARLLGILDSAGPSIELDYPAGELSSVAASMGPWDTDKAKLATVAYKLTGKEWGVTSKRRASQGGSEKEKWVYDLSTGLGSVGDAHGSPKHKELRISRPQELPVITDANGKVVRTYKWKNGMIVPVP